MPNELANGESSITIDQVSGIGPVQIVGTPTTTYSINGVGNIDFTIKFSANASQHNSSGGTEPISADACGIFKAAGATANSEVAAVQLHYVSGNGFHIEVGRITIPQVTKGKNGNQLTIQR